MRSLGRQSRHPVQVGMMLGLAFVAISQLVAGAAPHSVDSTFPLGSSQSLIALAMLVGTLLCLTATVLLDAWTAAGFELAGFCCLAGPFIADSYQIASKVALSPSDEITGFVLGALGGILWRGVQLLWDAYRIVANRRAPPIIEEPPATIDATLSSVLLAGAIAASSEAIPEPASAVEFPAEPAGTEDANADEAQL